MFGKFIHPSSEPTLTAQEPLGAKVLENRYDSAPRNLVERSEIARSRKRLQTPVQHCLTKLFMEPACQANLLGFVTESQLKGGGAFRHGGSSKRWYKKSQQNGSSVWTNKPRIVR